MKDLDNATRIPCSVSQELVDVIVSLYPDKFIKRSGEVDIYRLLFAIGFKIENNMYNKGIYTVKDALIRDNEQPSKVYKTSTVYNGTVRKRTTRCPTSGKLVFSRQQHELAHVYEKFEVVQPKELASRVDPALFEDIFDIGDKFYYDKGFADMDKPPSDNIRNIVRN